MSQDYTPVSWVDETTSQQGTLINAERLNQMQTAHHYADGFEEVDAIPTEDPGVDYHKVVYCTADATFYRWDGTQWTADIDEETKHLLDQEIARAEHAEGLIQGYLDAHEANHNNPHQVTKAQVGLGNCDNTADLDKPISTAAQAALDTKADKATTLAGYGITDAVATGGAQTVGGVKTFTDNPLVSNGEPALTIKNTDVSVTGTPASTEGATIHFAGNDGEDLARIKMTKGSSGMTILRAYIHGPHGDGEAHLVSDSQNTYMTGPARAYDPANASDIMTIGVYKTQTDTLLAAKADATALTDGSVTKVGTADLGTDTKPIKLVGGVPTAVTNDLATQAYVGGALDGYAAMVRTTGNQDIAGIKTFNNQIVRQGMYPEIAFRESVYQKGDLPSSETGLNCRFQDKNFVEMGNMAVGLNTNGSGFVLASTWDYTKTYNNRIVVRSFPDGTRYAELAYNRAYNASNTSDVATIATLDGYSPMVRTTGNQTINGHKIPEFKLNVRSYSVYSQDLNTKWVRVCYYPENGNYADMHCITRFISGHTFDTDFMFDVDIKQRCPNYTGNSALYLVNNACVRPLAIGKAPSGNEVGLVAIYRAIDGVNTIEIWGKFAGNRLIVTIENYNLINNLPAFALVTDDFTHDNAAPYITWDLTTFADELPAGILTQYLLKGKESS